MIEWIGERHMHEKQIRLLVYFILRKWALLI